MIKDIICWTIIAIIIVAMFVFTFSLCKSASEFDKIKRKHWKEYCRKENERMQEKAQKAYERYRERFARDYHLTIEEATEYQAVKNYKEYLEEQYKEHGVQICEKVGE